MRNPECGMIAKSVVGRGLAPAAALVQDITKDTHSDSVRYLRRPIALASPGESIEASLQT